MARVVFMGTPDFAVPTLTALIQQHDIVGVVTQPDRPAGRKGELKVPPIKALALANHIPMIQPQKLRQSDAKDWLSSRNADVFVVAAFGQILPQSVLDMPRQGCINVHGSLLPRWRGAAPIHAAIRAGDHETGITIMQMDAGLDTGPMLRKAAIPILPTDTSTILHDRMAELGARLLIETLSDYLQGHMTPEIQDNALATFAPQIEKEEGRLRWQDSAVALERQIRAFTPWPGTFTFWNGKLLKILSASVSVGEAAAGQVIADGTGASVGTGEGLLRLHEVQLEGKKRVTTEEFLRGYPSFSEAVLE